MPSAYSIGINSHDLDLPSINPEGQHNKVRVRRIGPQQLVSLGILNSMDSLGAIVKEAHLDRVQPQPSGGAWQDPAAGAGSTQGSDSILDEEQRRQLEFITKNAGRLEDTMDAIDKVVSMALLEPAVQRPVHRDKNGRVVLDSEGREIPLQPHERDPNVLYTDMIDQEDKNEIMNFAVSGVRSVEPFRQGRHADVVDLPAVEGVQHDPERAAEPGLPVGSVLPGPRCAHLWHDAGECTDGS